MEMEENMFPEGARRAPNLKQLPAKISRSWSQDGAKMPPKWLPGGLRGPSKSRPDLGPNKKVFFEAFWTPSWVPKNCLFRPRAAKKTSEAIFGKDFGGSGPFWEAFQHRPEKGPSKKRVLDPFLVTFGYFLVAFLGRLRRRSRCQKVLRKIHSPQRACCF